MSHRASGWKAERPIMTEGIRTSLSHPLEISTIDVGAGCGRIGLTFCPGKVQPVSLSGGWRRNLDLDMDLIERWGAAAVVTLLEPDELCALGVEDLGQAVADRHMSWFHLPIADVSVPDESFERKWTTEGPRIHWILRSGFDVLIHCKGGLGRAGMITARLLRELGWDASTAISEVRRVRPGAIETPDQETHVAKSQIAGLPPPDSSASAIEDRALGCLMGLAIGDALGTTLEFQTRDTKPRLLDMVGGGPFGLRAGQWTDDTSMALALADSLIKHGRLDEVDLMSRFQSWWREGRYSATGTCFDIGITTREALARFEMTGDPIAGSDDPMTAGNGSLMRLAPVVLHGFSSGKLGGVEIAARQSATTHAAKTAVDSCRHFAFILYLLITGKDPPFALAHTGVCENNVVGDIAAGSWRGKARSQIQSSGYVAHSLEAAFWCVGRTASFEDAVLLAANLGDDADTTAAITGQLAGALYGLSSIPERWLETLAWRERIEAAGRALLHGRTGQPVIEPDL